MLSFSLLALALGLSMDATAVAMTSGFQAPRVRLRDALLLALLFGGFQALMPVVGWAAGAHFAPAISAWDHWIAFGLLGAIGGKMLHGALAHAEGGARHVFAFRLRVLLLLALATSIDALVAGLTLPALDVRPLLAASVIGLTTFVLAIIGVEVGRRFGNRFGRKLDALGGVVLIGLGFKTLLQHLGG